MRTSLLIGGPVAALLLALGAAACGAPVASPGPYLSPGSRVAGTHSPASASAPAPVPVTASAATGPAAPASASLPASPGNLAGARLTSLAMASPLRGTGLFVGQSGARCQAFSGVTADGGARFRSASPIAGWNCNDNPPVRALAADDTGDAFAYGPGLFVRHGPAGRWRRSPQSGPVLAVSAVGRSVWLLLARCHGAAITAGGCALRLLESADGGRSWRSSPSWPPGFVTTGSATGPAMEPAAGQTWLLRAGRSAGYVLASPANPRSKQDPAAIWYTSDGGVSWSKRTLPCGIAALSDSVARAPGGTLIAVCAGQPSAGFQLKTTAVSADGGLSWTVHVGCLARPGCRNPLYDGYLGQITATSARTAYLAGDRSLLLVTTDGGVRWRTVTPTIGNDGGSYQVIFFGRRTGLVVAAGTATSQEYGLFRTSDGGRTWSEVIPELS